MRKPLLKIFFLLIFNLLHNLVLNNIAYAFSTEVGIAYSRKKTTFDSNNYVDSESTTGTLSLYFWEHIATEFSYTKAIGLRIEKASSTDSSRTIIQNTIVTGADLILILSDRKSRIQPYIKGGAAHIVRNQEIRIEGFGTETLTPESAITPSYGAGIKFGLTESLSFKVTYEVWQTPIGGDLKTDDWSLRSGFSWLL